MAGEERTEAASPKRRQEAREKGNLPRSVDLSASVVLLVGVIVLRTRLVPALSQMRDLMSVFITDAARTELTASWAIHIFSQLALATVQMLVPLFGAIAGTAIIIGVAQGGLPSSLKPLAPDFTKLNPISGFARLFSSRGVIELLKAMLKIGLLSWMGWAFMSDLMLRQAAMLQPDINDLFQTFLFSVDGVIRRLAFAFLMIGLVDYGYQRYTYEKNLRMTKEETKQEMKETEGNPQIKARIRQKMRQFATRRMMQQVPKAQVVITNPTHFAVALRYVPPMQAPKVVAKGADFVALRIREIAMKHQIPIVQNPPLAQALYKAVDLDKDIPGDLYAAVAEVLAFIYKARHGAAARR